MPALCDARALWVQRALFHAQAARFCRDIINTGLERIPSLGPRLSRNQNLSLTEESDPRP